VRDVRTHKNVGQFVSGFDHVSGTKIAPNELCLSSSPYFNGDCTALVIDETCDGWTDTAGRFIIAAKTDGKFSEIPLTIARVEKLMGQYPKNPKLVFDRWLGYSAFVCRLTGDYPKNNSERSAWLVIKVERDHALTILNADN